MWKGTSELRSSLTQHRELPETLDKGQEIWPLWMAAHDEYTHVRSNILDSGEYLLLYVMQ